MTPTHMTQTNTRLHNASGLTLVETTIVLAVVSVIVAAVWMVSSVVYENARQYQANRQVQTIVQNVRQLYTRVNALAVADVTVTLDRQFAFPVEMRVTQNTTAATADGLLNHPWVSLGTGSVKVYNADSTSFVVVFQGVPKKACIGLATKMTGGEITGIKGFKVGTYTGGAYTGSMSLPVTIVTAATACSGATNDVSWYFDFRS
jgi:Tfp pilus assembly protein PilE